jgi:hypothetical protein
VRNKTKPSISLTTVTLSVDRGKLVSDGIWIVHNDQLFVDALLEGRDVTSVLYVGPNTWVVEFTLPDVRLSTSEMCDRIAEYRQFITTIWRRFARKETYANL